MPRYDLQQGGQLAQGHELVVSIYFQMKIGGFGVT